MLLSNRKRLITVFVFIFCSVIALAKFGPSGSAGSRIAMLVPTITATDQDSIFTDVDMDGRADPGDTILYTVVINNGGTDATGVSFTDTLDPNMTVVSGLGQCLSDHDGRYISATGNVRIQVPDGATDLLGNDINPATGNNTGLTATAETKSSASCTGGCSNNVVIATNGSFSYNPPPGFEGADTFTYTVTDGAATSTGTATINVSGMIWFVDAAAAAGGDGRLTSPFNCLVGGRLL